MGNRERLQQHLMEHGEDSSGRANAERQRDDRDGGDEGRQYERAEGELETAHTSLRRPRYRRVYRLMLQFARAAHSATGVAEGDRPSAGFLGESDEKALRPPDVAEP